MPTVPAPRVRAAPDARTRTALVAPRGLDVSVRTPMRQALAAAAERGPEVVVDLSHVEFVDSAALGVLAAQHRELSARGGTLVLAAPRPRVRRLIRATGLRWLLER